MAENTLPLFSGAFYVYVYRDPRPRKGSVPIYVGKGTAALGRADHHWRRGSPNRLLNGILGKIRTAQLEPKIEIVGWFDDESAAFACERALIAQFGRRNLDCGPLCNLTDGGEGALGVVRSAETCAKIRAAKIGKPMSPATRIAALAANLGRKASAETRAKMSASQIIGHAAGRSGYIRTAEIRSKISRSLTGSVGPARSAETREKTSVAIRAHWVGRRIKQLAKAA